MKISDAAPNLRSALQLLAVLIALLPASAAADEHQAIIVFGAAGGEKYASEHTEWATSLTNVLQDRFAFPPERIVVLSETGSPELRSTRDNVTRVLGGLKSSVGENDLVLILLVGHGTVDATAAKFNLPGPDMDDTEWAALVGPIPGRVVFINASSGSSPFLQRLSAQNRIVITATDSPAQRFYTVFPDRFVAALGDPATDRDKNGKVSVWELFAATSAAVRQFYEQRGQLSTERPVLDDDGDGRGSEAEASGPDGALARTTYLDADVLTEAADPAVAALVQKQRQLEREAEELKLRKGSLPRAEWEAEFERLMIELARVSRAIRSRS
jgi:hypothetical protein